MFSSIATAPAKQSVGETITVLSGRLSSATLLEDRRAAILGLRSFAKEYPASVASGALRSLIGSLSKDGEDVDTVKVVLETLLMLFNPNDNSPEASEDISLWLADEFTQRQENVTLLLDFLETNDFYSRLYSLQLLSAILSARTERTEECIFTAPLGISRLVAVLDDRREAVRNEAIILLTYLTPTSPDIQKLVAFENAFERIFAIITAEGGLLDGDRIVEDCLILLANLLRLNSSNQSTFRETGGVPQLSQLLKGTYELGKEPEELSQWAQQQGNRNLYALLAVMRLFLAPGAAATIQNQAAFWQHGVLYHALQLAFSQAAELPIRAEALATCADVIRGNSKLQESFAQLQVPSVIPIDANGINGRTNGTSVTLVYVIDGLLDLTLSVGLLQAFDLRIAACQCLKAYFHNHPEIRLHFLHRAIEGFNSGREETGNVLTTLMQPSIMPVTSSPTDPYRHWFAAIILLHLLFDNPEAKSLAMAVTEGDAESGEEVVTSIQTITAHLIGGLSRGADDRIIVGYLMLLIGWLFNDLDGVNDFLGEGSNLQGLAQGAQHPTNSDLVRGLCAMLLGVVYEFSTKDSPIPRPALHEALLSRIPREKYIDALDKLRSHPFMRDFEVIPQKADVESGLQPDVFFDETFVYFFKDNSSRIIRAIDRDPDLEVSVLANGVQKGVSRELVDTLRGEIAEFKRKFEDAIADRETSGQRLGQLEADLRRATEELARVKVINEALQRHVDAAERKNQDYEQSNKDLARKGEDLGKALERKVAEIKSFEIRHKQQLEAKEASHREQLESSKREAQTATEAIHAEYDTKQAELQRQLEYIKKTSEAEANRTQRRAEAEKADLRATISRLEVDVMKANKTHSQELQAARDEAASKLAEAVAAAKKAEERSKDLEAQLKAAKAHAEELETQLEDRTQELEAEKEDTVQKLTSQLTKKDSELKKKDEEKAATQTELDDLLMVFGDLEEKVEKYKNQVQELGGTVSEDEDGDEEEDDEEEDGDVD
ncbi:p115 like vesicle tethering protein [Xylariales sp. PMI_506]|nr:p115 like vesicle tethering protein [Xylariales sp. PMI_506]